MICPNCKKSATENNGVIVCGDCGAFKANADGTAEPCDMPQPPQTPVAVPANPAPEVKKESGQKKPALTIRIEFEDD